MRLEYVTFLVRDPRPLRDWYTHHLGLSLVSESERSVQLEGQGGAKLLFHVGEPLDHPERVNLHFQVDDVDAEYRRLVPEGIEFDRPPEDMRWGLRAAYLKDPAGHTVELVTPIP
jgi:lactoylglutathione lyase